MQLKENRELVDRDEGIFNKFFLDDISSDLPKCVWNIQKDTTESVALIRNSLWPGYYAFHRVHTPIYGGVYIGYGIKNLDLLFMI